MENKNKEPNSKIDSETRSKLFDFYESVKKGKERSDHKHIWQVSKIK